MTFVLPWSRLPKNPQLIEDIEQAGQRLEKKCKQCDARSLNISDYNKRYFGEMLHDLRYTIQLRGYILAWALSCLPDQDYRKYCFVDYGGGTGILAILAKELGIGTVIYNDVYGVSCHDSQVIAEALGNKADFVAHGDIDDLIQFSNENNLKCDVIASYDVIEHIYRTEVFLKKLHLLNPGALVVFMSSGANGLNPRQKKLLTKGHLEREYHDRKPKWGIKPSDCPKAHLTIRREMIETHLSALSQSLDSTRIDELAKNTRGLIEPDIQKYVDDYLKDGMFPFLPDHPTNTCDPFNGNWAERLMDPYQLAEILHQNGFEDARVIPGSYGDFFHPAKRLVGRTLNVLIYVLKQKGIVFSPFYSLFALKKASGHYL